MTARQWLQARLVATRDFIFTTGSDLSTHVTQRGLAAAAVRNNVGGPRTVGWFCLLNVARLLALVLAAIEIAIAHVATFEKPGPFLDDFSPYLGLVKTLALLLIIPVATKNLFLHAAAVAARFNTYLACTTETFMARLVAKVLPTGHELSAYVSATPAILVVRIKAFPGF
ncbi:hypothetical protein MPH_07858 [Macrophomina phaseolina MS6]|uniref:Uncharacterized protein n=1 Tax=Macrophomina phaseolina (strain MS6) TaxID=1126212 RepID=K2RJY3_MACPH|nr:hypothetical protein MPH_07858 [Macrophomina phaseolina MS6]